MSARSRVNVPLVVTITLFVVLGGGCFAILALSAVLGPVFTHASRQAKATACLSQMKQVSLAILMYSSDYDEALPPGSRWMDATVPYTKTERLFQCPEVGRGTGDYGYAMNIEVQGKRKPKQAPAGGWPVLVFDSTTKDRNAVAAVGGAWPVPGRHNGKNSVAFLDGVVRLIPDSAPPKR